MKTEIFPLVSFAGTAVFPLILKLASGSDHGRQAVVIERRSRPEDPTMKRKFAAAVLVAITAACKPVPHEPAEATASNTAISADGRAEGREDKKVLPLQVGEAKEGAPRDSYDRCLEKAVGITPAIQECVDVEYEYRDKRLNDAYKALTASLSKDRLDGLREEQRAWIKKCDADCDEGTEPGQGQVLEAGVCLVSMTAARANELEIMLVQASSKQIEADAACDEGGVLFHCATTNGKEIRLCDLGGLLEYSYGSIGGPPELALSVPRGEATTTQWDGVGRWISYSITIPSGKAKYTLFTSVDRLPDENGFEAGVTATFGGTEVARIMCRNPIIHNLEGVDLREEEQEKSVPTSINGQASASALPANHPQATAQVRWRCADC